MESLEHLTGMCGETHLNLFTALIILLIIKTSVYAVYQYRKNNLN